MSSNTYCACQNWLLLQVGETEYWSFSFSIIGRTDPEAKAPVLCLPDAKSWLIREASDAGKDWGQETKGATEDDMVGWHHWLNGPEFEPAPGVGDEQGGPACCGLRKESDSTEQLNNNRQRNWTRVTQKEGLTQITKFRGRLALATSALWFLLSISQLHLPGRDALHITYFKQIPLSQRKENLVSFTSCLSVQFDLWSLNNTRLRATSLNAVANPCIIVMGTLYPCFHICSFGQPQAESHPWTCCSSDPRCSGNSCLRDMMALCAP